MRCVVACIAFGVVVGACSSFSDAPSSDDAGTSSGTSSGTSTTSTSGASGGTCAKCAAAAPADWLGPTVYAENPPICPPGAQVGKALHDQLDVPATGCECSCEAAKPPCTVKFYGGDGAGTCSAGGGVLVNAPLNTCVSMGSAMAFQVQVNATPPSCAEKVGPIPPPKWKVDGTICERPLETCGDRGVCMPPGATVCVYRSGAFECPAGTAYTQKKIRYASFSSSRACMPCGCGPPTGASCKWNAVYSRDQNDCLGTTLTVTETTSPNCQSRSGTTASGKLASVSAVAATCLPLAPGAVVGSASAAEPTTLCCAP